MRFISSVVEWLFAGANAEANANVCIIELFWPYFNFLAFISLLLFVYMLPSLWKRLRQVPRAVWADVLFVTVLGLCLRLWLSPRCPQVYFDEICYGELASSLRQFGQYCVYLEHPERMQIMPFLPGWPFVLAWLGRIFTFNWAEQSLFCLFMAGLAVPLSYAVGWHLYARRSFAAALAVLVAAWPLHLRLSACSALENGSFLLFLLLALFLLIWRDTRDNRWLWSSACVWVWFANWRMENLAIITGVLLLSLSIEYGRVWKWWRVADFYAVGALAVLLAWPGLLCDVYGIHSHFYLTDSTSVHNSAFLGSKMAANWLFWVNNHFHPVFYTLLAAVSVFLAWNRFYMLAWLAWFVVLNVFYGFIPTADFELLYTCDSWRNSLFPTWGMLVLAADGFAMIYHRLSLRGKGWTVLWIAAFLLGVAVQPWAKYSYIAQRNTWIREFQLAERIGRRLPENADLLLSGSALRTMGNSLYIKIWDRGSSAQWHWYVLPDSAIIHAPGEPFPELLRATRTWKNDGRRIFLCISGSQKSSWDSYRWRWFNKYYDLRLLDGEAVPYEGDYITLYEIDGLTEAAERWINAGTAE